LKAGGVGLNLTVANHAFLVDPWWNPAVEEQAVERIHRIGQKKNVEVVRFICKETIEERIIELHQQKKDLFDSTVTYNQEERKNQNIENFKYLMKNYKV
jgi:SNF2 family DNA or RNA helicase